MPHVKIVITGSFERPLRCRHKNVICNLCKYTKIGQTESLFPQGIGAESATTEQLSPLVLDEAQMGEEPNH